MGLGRYQVGITLDVRGPARGASVIVLSVLYLLVLIFDFVAQHIQFRIMQCVGQQTTYMRTRIFARLQQLPMSYFDRNPVGRLVTCVTTDLTPSTTFSPLVHFKGAGSKFPPFRKSSQPISPSFPFPSTPCHTLPQSSPRPQTTPRHRRNTTAFPARRLLARD